MERWTILLLLFSCMLTSSESFNVTEIGSTLIYESPVSLEFNPVEIVHLYEQDVQVIKINYTIHDDSAQQWRLSAKIKDAGIAEIVGKDQLILDTNLWQNETNATLTVRGKFLGRTIIEFFVKPLVMNTSVAENSNQTAKPSYDHGEWQELGSGQSYRIAVVRRPRPIDAVFTVVIATFVIVANIGMGCKIDLDVVKEVLKRPFAPGIGFGCQFIFMPLLSFSIIKLLGLKGGVALGFFAMGCSPGGGASNLYTYLLDGDVSLSITMTLISTFSSLAMIPFWLFTLGRLLIDENTNVNIPFQNIFISLFSILIPVAIGILIQKKRPLWAKKIAKILKPIFLIFIIFMFSFGLYANLYIFKLFTPVLILAGCLLPYCGFTLGGICAFIFRQPKARIIAICIETGIQNPGVAILLMKFSLPQPDSDMSLVSPVVTSTFTPAPLIIAVICYYVYKKCFKKEGFQEVPKEDSNKEEEMEDMSDKTILNNVKDSDEKSKLKHTVIEDKEIDVEANGKQPLVS